MRLDRPRPERSRSASALSTIAGALLGAATPAFADLEETGRWTPLPTTTPPAAGSEANWEHLQVHMALLRGDENFHSYILSWNLVPDESTWEGGLWGWNPASPDDGCLAYPASTLVRLDQPDSPGVQIFCAGLAALPDGRLLVTGGTDRVGATAGIKDVRVFDPLTGAWSADDTMSVRRYYPTNTTLPDGRVLVTQGWQFDHMLTFGGRSLPAQASSAKKDLGRLTILKEASWDAPITDPGGATPWPDERAFHTAVERQDPADLSNSDLYRMIVFGGLDTAGVARSDAWAMSRSQWYEHTEKYVWEQLPNAPVALAHHGALVASDQNMYVFGGVDDDVPSATRSEVRRLRRDPTLGWQWNTVTTSGSDPPGARQGHTVAYDRSPGRNRMIVFGGSDGSGLADNEVYALDFGVSFSSFTWKKLTRMSGSPSPPAAREAHTIVVGDRRFVRNATPNWTRMLVFGGETSGGLTNELWTLWIHPSTDEVEWQQVTPATPNGAPTARAGHTAIWQRPANDDRMLVFGGETSGGAGDSLVWVLAIDSLAMEWIPEAMPGVARAGHTARLDLIPVQATLPEVYDPDASPGSRWSSLAAPRRYQYYPFTFVLPSGDVFLAGPQTDSYRLDLDTPQWSSALWANIWTWSAAMYRPGKIVKIGGTGGNGYDTAHIEFNASNSTSGWSQANTDLVHRYLPQLTILPDGRLIATGGVREPKANRVPMRKPQIWSPPTGGFPVGTWGDTLAADPAARDHHSTAILLPDGRVLTAGVSDLELVDSDKATIFCPPYLFIGDSLVTRPVITAAPDSIIWGRPFSVTSPQAGDSLVAALVRPSAVTHSFNQNQLYVPLVFRENESGRDLVLDAPVGGTYAPPGDYMLFLLDAAGVPSIASWVRVRDEPGDESCADVAPAPVTLSAPEVGRHSIKLTWTAPGENGACGTAEAYDVRRSSSTITEANFYAATPVTANLPAPSETATEQCMEVDFLSSCTTYRFAIRTRDAEGVWSWISNSVTAQTACSGNMEVLCDGGGLLVGGGGGGGEEGLRGGFALAASTPTLLEASEVAARENSLLHAGDEAGLDLIALPQGEVAGDERVIVDLRPAGDWAAEIDVLALGVIDHDRALVAVPDAERVLLGTIAPLAGANALRSGEALLSLPGASTTTALVIESRAPAPRPGESAATILVQVDDGASWRTVSVVRPRRAFDRRAIAIGAVESVRLVLSGECSIRTLERMEVAESRVIEPLDLVEAHGERSEEIAAGLGEAGGTEARLEPGEHTSLVFDAPARDPELRRSSFLLARGRLVATGSAASMATTRAGADPAQEFVFALGSARPNPGPGPVTIEYSLARRTQLDLRLYSVTGRLVRTLVREERPAGPGVVVWDGRDDHGKEAEPGAYFCRMTADEWQSGRKLVIVRR